MTAQIGPSVWLSLLRPRTGSNVWSRSFDGCWAGLSSENKFGLTVEETHPSSAQKMGREGERERERERDETEGETDGSVKLIVVYVLSRVGISQSKSSRNNRSDFFNEVLLLMQT